MILKSHGIFSAMLVCNGGSITNAFDGLISYQFFSSFPTIFSKCLCFRVVKTK